MQRRESPPLEFEAVAPARAVDEVAAQIRDLVASGRLTPGDRLPAERELSARLHVSRNTLRESLRALEHAGIVEMRKGAAGGAFVRPGSSGVIVTGMRDLYHLGAITPQQLTEARIWLSEIVVRVACERATEQDLQELEANMARASLADDAGDFDTRQRQNREFNVVLARITRNPILIVTMEGLMGVFGRFIEQVGPRANAYTLPSRKRLLKHLRARDAEAAVAEMTRYLRRLHKDYLTRWTERAASTGWSAPNGPNGAT